MSLFYPPLIRNHVERLYTGIIRADGIIPRTNLTAQTQSPRYIESEVKVCGGNSL